MTTLLEMHQKTTSCKEYDRMLRSVAPMCDYFNVSQFYYNRIQTVGDQEYFSTIGTNLAWHEYSFENIERMAPFPLLKDLIESTYQIALLNKTPNSQLNAFLDNAWSRFNINFTIQIQKKIPFGLESFGFGVRSRHPMAEQHLLNELPLLHKFITYFHEENGKLIDLVCEHQVKMSSPFGPPFEETYSPYLFPHKRELLLKQLGLDGINKLTIREIDVLKFIANGFPANYIAQQLCLSSRTVENYIAVIKSKLDCTSKIELIKKAQEMILVINPI